MSIFDCQCERCAWGDPELTVRFSWTIKPDGSVEAVIPDSLVDEAAVRCMTSALHGWKFPARKTATTVKTFPVAFRR